MNIHVNGKPELGKVCLSTLAYTLVNGLEIHYSVGI